MDQVARIAFNIVTIKDYHCQQQIADWLRQRAQDIEKADLEEYSNKYTCTFYKN